MPRPRKCRKVCSMPGNARFVPDGHAFDEEACVVMTIEEYESIRLIDYQGFTQEDAARHMKVARSTIQQIYTEARRKLSVCLVEGKSLQIAGGNYQLCDGAEEFCGCGGCRKHRGKKNALKHMGGSRMKIAVTYERGEIFQHFGHTEHFGIYEAEDQKVISKTVVDTAGSGHGALAGFLQAHQVDVLICGGIGGGAQTALAEAGIKLYGGASGDADEAVEALLAGQLAYKADVKCDHHDHQHGSEGHACGSHGCGKH